MREQASAIARTDDAAFRQLMDKLDMEGIKPFMCPDSHGSAMKCLNCNDFKVCQPGQRAVRLLDETTRATELKTAPQFVRKWSDTETHTEERESNNPTAIEREEFRKACQSGNAWHWLMQTRGLSKDAAGELLSKLIKRYPNVSAEYGGGRRIMQRPKVVKIISESEEPQAAYTAQQQPTDTQGDPHTLPVQQAPETAPNSPKHPIPVEAIKAVVEMGRENCRNAIASGDPEQFLINQGRTKKAAYERVRRWKEKYPDLFEGLQLPQRSRGRKAKEATEQPQPPQTQEQQDEDEISLADFLNQYDQVTGPAVQPQQTTPESISPPEEQKQPENSDPMLEAMNHRLQALKAEKQRVEAEIQAAENRAKQIQDQMQAIETCLAQFQ